MRGIASLVVVYHLPCIHGFKMQYAYLAVEFFFVLSGWVMAIVMKSVSATACRSKTSPSTVWRLYPLYLCATLFGFLIMLVKMRFGTPSSCQDRPGYIRV